MTLGSARLSIAALLISLAMTGCGASTAGVGTLDEGAREADTPEKRMFSVMTRYYCEHKRWPKTLEDVEAYHESVLETPLDTKEFRNPTLESSRAVVLTLSYDNAIGVRRKISFIAPPRCDDEKVDGEISIAAGRIRFEVPSGFSLMGTKAVKDRWRSPPFPDAAWRDESGVLIAIRFGDVDVAPAELESLEPSLAEAYESSVPSLAWVRKGPRKIDEKVILEHAFESDSSTGRLVNFVVSTSFDGKLLAITLIGRVEDSKRLELMAEQVENSLRLE